MFSGFQVLNFSNYILLGFDNMCCFDTDVSEELAPKLERSGPI
jgi:hypothetical protein